MAKNKVIFPRERWQMSAQMFYLADELGAVVTKSEAAKLWGKAESTIEMQIAKGRLEARTSLTGGAVLITYKSLVALWGEPVLKSLQIAKSQVPF
jgi:hypothetical protein